MGSLNLHDFGGFGFEGGIDLVGEFFGEVVDGFFGAFLGVFGEFGGLEGFAGVFADVAEGDFSLFDFVAGGFDDFFATFFGQRGDGDADDATVIGGVEAEGGVVADGGGDGREGAGVEGGDGEEGGVGDGDVGDLVERGELAVDFDFDTGEHVGVGAAGADFFHFVMEAVESGCHLSAVRLCVEHIIISLI